MCRWMDYKNFGSVNEVGACIIHQRRWRPLLHNAHTRLSTVKTEHAACQPLATRVAVRGTGVGGDKMPAIASGMHRLAAWNICMRAY